MDFCIVSCSIGDQMHQRLIHIFEAVVAHTRERRGDGGRSPLSPKATISHYLAAAKTEPFSGCFLSTVANLPSYQRYYITDIWRISACFHTLLDIIVLVHATEDILCQRCFGDDNESE